MPDKPMPVLRSVASLVLLGAGTAAVADVPPGVEKMITAAKESGDSETLATVARIAKQAYPDAAKEIDALAALGATEPLATADASPIAAPMAALNVVMASAPPIQWDGEGELGGFLTTGNTDSFGITAGLKVSRVSGAWKHGLSGRLDYQEANHVVTREFFQFGYKADWQMSDNSYAFGLGLYESDRLAGFSSRFSAGAGLGLKLAARPTISINLEGGPAVRTTLFSDGHTETNLTGRGAVGVDWRISKIFRAQQNTSLYTEAGEASIEATTALDATLMRKLTARLSYSLRGESRPQPDTVTRASVVYAF